MPNWLHKFGDVRRPTNYLLHGQRLPRLREVCDSTGEQHSPRFLAGSASAGTRGQDALHERARWTTDCIPRAHLTESKPEASSPCKAMRTLQQASVQSYSAVL